MARESVCGNLKAGQDVSCLSPFKRFYQQAVIMNKSDIEEYTINMTPATPDTAPCAYSVSFTLKEGKTGFLFKGSESASSYKGSFAKTRDELMGLPQYVHTAQILIVGVNETAKCIMDSLDKGSFVVAFQFKDGTVEIYGLENGLVSDDYTMDMQENGGGQVITLSSLETGQERYLPLVYKSNETGSETEDFDSLFANPAA